MTYDPKQFVLTNEPANLYFNKVANLVKCICTPRTKIN